MKKVLSERFSSNPKKQLYTILKGEGFIAHLAEQLLSSLFLTKEDTCANLSKDKRNTLIYLLTAYPFTITGKKGFNAAMVTSGGVALAEVDRKTMGSRHRRGLYFCGENPRYRWGYWWHNLQAAFSTAKLAADTILKEGVPNGF